MTEIFKNIIYMARRFKLATALNMLGLIVAFAAFYIMMTQITYQAAYNRGVEDSERLYRIDTDFLSNSRIFCDEIYYPFADVLDAIPEVESYSLVPYIDNNPVFSSFYEVPFLTQDKDSVAFTIELSCNNTAVSTLTSKVLSGNIEWSDNDPNPNRPGVIIPKSIAIRYFGKTDVAGDSMMVNPNYNTYQGKPVYWSIRGVYEDFPKNSELRNCIYTLMNKEDQEYNRHSFDNTYKCIIKLKRVPDDVEMLSGKIKQAIIDKMEKEGWEKYATEAKFSVPALQNSLNTMKIRLTPLEDSYFVVKSLSSGKHGFKPMFLIMRLACLLLIILAAIHFLNFALVESPMRIRGINTRLVLGAPKKSLQRGIIIECVITSIIACVIALIICGVLSSRPSVDQLIDGTLAVHRHWLIALFTVFVASIAGIFAGVYPAIFATSFTPAMALKGNFGLTPQGHNLRKVIIGVQLFISFLMFIYLGILIQEKRYIFDSPYLYDKDNVLISTVPLNTDDSTKQLLYRQLTAIPGVRNVSFSDGSMGLSDSHGSIPVEVKGHSFSINPTYVDSAYLRTLDIRVVEGRNFQPTDSNVAIINKSAKGLINVGSKIPIDSDDDSVTIVGVCDDIRYNTTRFESNQPFIIILSPTATRIHLNMSVARDANAKNVQLQANNIIQNQLRDTTGLSQQKKTEILERTYPTHLTPFNKRLEKSYESEFRFFKLIFILSTICTLITLIGVFCLTMFETEYRRKEIGIRKVAGAKSGEIILMLCRQYIPSILISFAVAAPIAYICGEQTLAYFAEHTPIQWWIYPLALLIVGGIVMSTILLQSWRAARENPVNSIKTE